MFLVERKGAINTTEMVMLIVLTLLALVVPAWRLMSSIGARFDSIRQGLGN